MYVNLVVLSLLMKEVLLLKLLQVTVPPNKLEGESAQLECDFDLESDKLYSVKWYRDYKEFYRYKPDDKPSKQVFENEGVNIDLEQSDDKKVILNQVNLKSAGLYHCEVTMGAPSFESAIGEGRMEIIASHCPENEWYSECTQAHCSVQNCSHVGFPISCPDIDPKYCEKGCLCKENYARNDQGVCVPMNNCPPQCPENERYSECTQGHCSVQNCSQVGFPIPCPDIDPKYCEKGCICLEHYARNDKGVCVPVNNCPTCEGDPNKIAGCGVYCNQRCRDVGMEPGACMRICFENACSCRDGYYLDETTGSCVLPQKCTPQCPENEWYSDCIQAQCNVKNCSQVGLPIACPRINPKHCIKGCLCKEGYARNYKNKCVSLIKCRKCFRKVPYFLCIKRSVYMWTNFDIY